MPIGSLIPDTPTPVTPDTSPTRYTSVDGPAVNDFIIADHVLLAMLMALNVQEYLINLMNTRSVSQHKVGSTSAMQALTGVASSDVCYVNGHGYFTWWGTATYAMNEPWLYPATGMGAGVWVSDLALVLLGTPSDPTISSALIDQPLLAFGSDAPASNITYANTTSTPTTIATKDISVSGFAGKTLRLSVSGLVAEVTGSFGSVVNVLLTFNDSVPTSQGAGSLFLPVGTIAPLHLGYDFPIPAGATLCSIAVRGETGGGELKVTGQTDTQWLQWSIITIPG